METVVAENEGLDRGAALRKGFRMGDWTVRPIEGMIDGRGGQHHLQPKSMDVLLCLACSASEVVERDELIEHVWGRTAVTDEPLTRCIHDIRRELNDTREHPTYIQTIPKRGYRLIVPVEAIGADTTHKGSFARILRALFSRYGLSIAAVAAILAIVAGLSQELQSTEAIPPLATNIHSIAVLPFETSGDEVVDRWLGDGLAEDLLNLLAGVNGLEVAARSSSFRRFPAATDIVRIGHDLNVHYILKGSVERDADRLRVNVWLIDAQTRHRLWSQAYERPAHEWFVLQEGIAQQVVIALLPGDVNDRMPLPPMTDRPVIAVAPTSSIEAYDYHLQARSLLQDSNNLDSLDAAAEYFSKAIQLDAGFASAYAGLCATFVQQLQLNPLEQIAKTVYKICSQGVALHPDSIEMRSAYADLYRVSGQPKRAIVGYRWVIDRKPHAMDAYLGMAGAYASLEDFDEAERAYRRAINVKPDDERAYRDFGSFLFARGRYGEALELGRRMIQLNPESVAGYTILGDASFSSGRFTAAIAAYREVMVRDVGAMIYSRIGASQYYLGRYQDAALTYQQAAALTPLDHHVWADIGDVYTQIAGGDLQAEEAYHAARELIEEELKIMPGNAVDRIGLAYYCAALGESVCARYYSAEAVESAPEVPLVHYLDALVQLRLGHEASAVMAVERALQLGYPRALLTVDPQLATVRNSPRLSGMFFARQDFVQNANFQSRLSMIAPR